MTFLRLSIACHIKLMKPWSRMNGTTRNFDDRYMLLCFSSNNIWCAARFGPFVQFKKHEKHPWRSVTLLNLQVLSSLGAFYVFKILQMVQNRAKHPQLICRKWFSRLPLCIFLLPKFINDVRVLRAQAGSM